MIGSKILNINLFFNYKDKFLALLFRVLGIPLTFFLNIYLSRLLDVGTYGSYLAVTQLFFFVVNISILGLGPIIIKKASVFFERKKHKELNTFLFESLIPSISLYFILCFSLFLGRHKLMVIYSLDNYNLNSFLIYFILGSLLQLIIWILNFYYISFRQIWQSNFNERFLVNGSFFVVLFLFSGLNFNLELVALSFLVSRFISLIVSFVLIKKSFKPFIYSKPNIRNIKKILKQSWPIWISNSTIQVYNVIPLQMIVLLTTTESAALFGVAFSLSTLTSFLIKLSYSYVGSDIANNFANNNKIQLAQINSRISLRLGLIGIFFFVFFIFFGEFLLSFWGSEYTSAYYVLLILSFSQIINSFGGISELILNICGLQRKVFHISTTSLFLSLIFSVILTYFYGYIGTAVGYMITIISYNFLKLKLVHKYTNDLH